MNRLIRMLAAGSLLMVACGGGGSDFEETPLSLSEWDHGWLIVVEPEETFDIGLAHSAVHPDIPWRLVDSSPAVVALDNEQHVPAGNAEQGDPALAHTVFEFAGVDIGESTLAFELVVGGTRIDIAEFTVAVVEDACAENEGARANRCGESFTFHPQTLTEHDHGTTISLGTDEMLDVILTANALFPDTSWTLTEVDGTAVDVSGPTAGPADRDSGDWSAWDADTRHSFLPTSAFTIAGGQEGEATLVFELAGAEGQPVDRFEMTVVVSSG